MLIYAHSLLQPSDGSASLPTTCSGISPRCCSPSSTRSRAARGTTAAIFSGTNALEQAGERGKNAALARKAAGVIKQVHLSSTQGPGVLLNVGELV